MAYVINSGDIALVTARYTQLNTLFMLNTFHFRYMGTTPVADGRAELMLLAQTVDSLWDGAGWSSRWAQNASNMVNIDRYWAQKIYPVRYGQVTWDMNYPGDVDAQPLPSVVQWSITRKGELATRFSRGGIRVPGLPDTFEVGGLLTGPAMANAIVIAQTLKANLLSSPGREWEPIIFRKSSPTTSVRVVETFPQEVVRSQRTRIAFRGI